jgi:hypothetical protein
MATFSFTTSTSGRIVATATGVADRSFTSDKIREVRIGGGKVVIDLEYTDIQGDYKIDPAADTVTIGVTTYTPGQLTASQLKAAIDASTVFLKANSGTGGTGLTQAQLDFLNALMGVDNP